MLETLKGGQRRALAQQAHQQYSGELAFREDGQGHDASQLGEPVRGARRGSNRAPRS